LATSVLSLLVACAGNEAFVPRADTGVPVTCRFREKPFADPNRTLDRGETAGE
jgi:hypothetical protein